MDETPVFLDLLPSKVVDRKREKVFGYAQQKSHYSVLCCTASGKLLPPFVIFKGKTMEEFIVALNKMPGWMRIE